MQPCPQDAYFYKTFGLTWKSYGLKFPELLEVNNQNYFDISIQQDNSKNWSDFKKGIYDTDFVNFSKNEFRLIVNKIGKYKVVQGNSLYWDKYEPRISNQDLRTFLLSIPLGAILIQRDILLFHGNAMERNGESIICLGHSGAGKSTLAYSLMQQGWNLLADDIVAISSDGYVLPGIPRIKLWQDSLKFFNIDPLQLYPVREEMNKFILDKDKLKISYNRSILKSIYLIRHNKNAEEDKNNKFPTKVENEKFKFISLRNNIFRPRLIKGLNKEKKIVEKIFNIVKEKNLYVLYLPRGIDKMQQHLACQNL